MALVIPLLAPSVVFLDEPGATDHDLVGVKAALLAELSAAGLPVPQAFVVTADGFRRCLDAAGVLSAVRDIEAGVDPTDDADLLRCSGHLTRLIAASSLTSTVRAEVLDAHQHLSAVCGGRGEPIPVVVRSSVPNVSAHATFAGVTRSYTSVLGESDVLHRIVDCWTSNVSPRAIAYRARCGLLGATDMGVLVQSMVMSDRAAIASSADPTTGGRDHILVEAVRGLGAVVANGTVRPDRYTVERAHQVVDRRATGRQDHQIAVARGCSERRRELSVDPERSTLSPGEVLAISAHVERAEQQLGGPQDVEVAIDGHGELFVVQSRPSVVTSPTGCTPSVVCGATEPPADSGAPPRCRGTAGSAGRASGIARVLSAPGAAGLLGQGEILVVATAAPEWLPALDRAAAVVTDQGGAMSNLAVLCRERRIPAVIGTGCATTTLPSGSGVTVDGHLGTVG